jgi:hypothetical protein
VSLCVLVKLLDLLNSCSSFLNACQDFATVIVEKVMPARKRHLHVEILSGSFNFKGWVEQVPVNLSGLTPNVRARGEDESHVNHCWRFVRRCETWLNK